MKCYFCNGFIDPLREICIMCGRTTDVEMELRIKKEQAKDHPWGKWWNVYKGERRIHRWKKNGERHLR